MDVMLDLETWGTAPGCAIRSVGAVAFSTLTSDVSVNTYYANVDDDSCVAAGLTIDPSTAIWWGQQSAAAKEKLVPNKRSLLAVTVEFHAWFVKLEIEHVWCQGATFDVPIWEAACRAVGVRKTPWRFDRVRDTRTLYALVRRDPREDVQRLGEHHDALQDAIYQARCVQHCLAQIRRSESVEDMRECEGEGM